LSDLANRHNSTLFTWLHSRILAFGRAFILIFLTLRLLIQNRDWTAAAIISLTGLVSKKMLKLPTIQSPQRIGEIKIETSAACRTSCFNPP
jgi:hypothetical protein